MPPLVRERSCELAMANKNVLVVEDNDVNFQLVEYVLKDMGITVSRAATGDEAWAMLMTEEQPDLVLMDIQLPTRDGLDVTRQVRAMETDHHLTIVALSAMAMAGDREKALAAGCDAYLSKPVSMKVLRETVGAFLEGRAIDGAA